MQGEATSKARVSQANQRLKRPFDATGLAVLRILKGVAAAC